MPYLGNNLYAANTSYRVIDSIASSFNGSTTSFPLKVGGAAPVPFPINPQNCLISVGGVPQQPDTTGASGFTFSGSNIVFSSAPASGEAFWGVILAGADYVTAGTTYPNGSASVPSITFSSNTSTGMYLVSPNVLGFTTAGVQGMNLNASSNLSVVGDITALTSDMRLKTEIQPITDALNKVCSLDGFTYKFNKIASQFGLPIHDLQVGVSAQKVKEVVPEAVKPAPFDTKYTENGESYSKSGENYITVQYEKLVPLLIEAVKELKKEIETLKGAV
jgi:hypothetical protein